MLLGGSGCGYAVRVAAGIGLPVQHGQRWRRLVQAIGNPGSHRSRWCPVRGRAWDAVGIHGTAAVSVHIRIVLGGHRDLGVRCFDRITEVGGAAATGTDDWRPRAGWTVLVLGHRQADGDSEAADELDPEGARSEP